VIAGKPSRTAFAAAMHRAAHQLLEGGRIFSDPLALAIVGQDAASIVGRAQRDPASAAMRLFIAVRTRFAEDACAAAVGTGIRQIVVLGAGLDTYAYRAVTTAGLRIFEVDHPATQAWKRERLAAAAIAVPAALCFAPVDFERETLTHGLAAAGFDATRPAVFSWLGVTPYLSAQAIWSTLGFVAGLAAGTQVVFDYANPPHTLTPAQRRAHRSRARRVAELGEAWQSFFETAALHSRLRASGFRHIEDLGPQELVRRYLGTEPPASDSGGHVLHAAT
jgi:methyltransferase (TIGR00027 family)